MKNSEKIIKVIDGISKATAIFLGIAFSMWSILVTTKTLTGQLEVTRGVAILMVIILMPFSVALAFAPVVRQKGKMCKIGVALLMLPTFIFFLGLSADISCLFNHKRDELKLIKGDTIIGDIILNWDIVIIVSLLIVTLYVIQYYLLFKGKKVMEVQTYLQSGEETDEVKLPTIDGLEKPLFVLKYSRWRVWAGNVGGLFVFGTPLLYLLSLIRDMSLPLGAKIASIFVSVACIGLIIFPFFRFKEEFRLYKDRLIKKGYFGQEEVKLEEAYIKRYKGGYCPPGTLIAISGRKIRIPSLHHIIEDLCNPKDIKKFHTILAKLSGRDIKEFKGSIRSQKLIKEVTNNGKIN